MFWRSCCLLCAFLARAEIAAADSQEGVECSLTGTCSEGWSSPTFSQVSDEWVSLLSAAQSLRIVVAPTDSIAPQEVDSSFTTVGFPTKLNNQVGLGAAERIIEVMGVMKIHIYDAGLYIDPRSPLWGKTNTLDQLLDGLPGHATIRTICAMKASYNKVEDEMKEKLKPRVREEGDVAGYDEFIRKLKTGPHLHKGSSMMFELEADGVRIITDGQDLGFIKSRALARGFIAEHLGDDAIIPKLRAAVFDRLESPAPVFESLSEDAFMHVAQGDESGNWKVIAICICAAVVLLLILACMCWYCCCRRKPSESEKA